MPSYSRFIGTKMRGGSTGFYGYPPNYPELAPPQPHSDFLLGSTQTMVCSRPKGSPFVLVRDQDTYGFYLPLYEVSFNRVKVEATPLRVWFWMYADGKHLWYDEPSGLARLNWFQSKQVSIPPNPSQRMKDIALTMALSRVGTGPFMGAVDLGEVTETLKFIRRPFKSLADIFTGYTKKVERNFAKAAQQRTMTATRKRKSVSKGRKWYPRFRTKEYETKWRSELLADTWLEYRYAASPLVLSTLSLAEESTRKATEMCQRIHSARGANVDNYATAYLQYPDWILDGVDLMRRSVNVNESIETKVAYVIRYAYRPWMVDAINLARFGLSPTQVLSTTWELLPLSFVGDWFVNFGTWLKAMEPKPQCKIIDVAYTHTYKHECYIQDTCCGAFSYYNNLPGVDASARFERFYMKRENVTDNLQAPIPRMLGKEMSMLQTLDSISLLARPISKFFGRYGNLIPRME